MELKHSWLEQTKRKPINDVKRTARKISSRIKDQKPEVKYVTKEYYDWLLYHFKNRGEVK